MRFAQAINRACNAARASERAVFKSGAVTRTTANLVAGFILLDFSERQRRDIFVAPNPVVTQAPSGAAYSDDAAPDGAWKSGGVRYYKDFAPTALTNDQMTAITSLLVEFVLVKFITMTQVTGIILILLSIGILIYWLATGRRSKPLLRFVCVFIAIMGFLLILKDKLVEVTFKDWLSIKSSVAEASADAKTIAAI